MQLGNEILWIICLIMAGILFFWMLERSIKVESLLLKIPFILIADACVILLVEAIQRLISDGKPVPFSLYSDDVGIIVSRATQLLLGIVGTLMCVGLALVATRKNNA